MGSGSVRVIAIVLAALVVPLAGALALRRSVTQVTVTRDTADPAELLLRADEISLTSSDGVRLSAWSIRGRPGAPPIVLVHDLGGSRGDLLNAAVILNRAG